MCAIRTANFRQGHATAATAPVRDAHRVEAELLGLELVQQSPVLPGADQAVGGHGAAGRHRRQPDAREGAVAAAQQACMTAA